jgi:hypothetical protein
VWRASLLGFVYQLVMSAQRWRRLRGFERLSESSLMGCARVRIEALGRPTLDQPAIHQI